MLEHLENFVAVVDLLVELGAERGFTVVLSVPNDAFWSIENPVHPTMWGEGAFEELRRLLPGEHVVTRAGARSRARRSRRAGAGDARARRPRACEAERVPVALPAGLRPARPTAWRRAGGDAQADAAEERRWERERRASLAFMAARLQELESAS